MFDFKRIETQDIISHLEMVAKREGVNYEPDALGVIAKKAEGGLRDALSTFDQLVSFTGGNLTYKGCLENLNMLDSDYYFRFVDLMRGGDIGGVLLLYQEIIDKGFDGQHFITGLTSHLRNLIVAIDAATLPLLDVGEADRARFGQQAQACGLALLMRLLEIASDYEYRFRDAGNKRLFVEVALMKMAGLMNGPAQAAG